jgi:hypothetical protein
MREQLSGVPESSCLVYHTAAAWCTRDQLSGVPEISCLMYHRAAVWCSKGFRSLLTPLRVFTMLNEKLGTDIDIVRSILFVTDEEFFISANKKITPQVENNNIQKCIYCMYFIAHIIT